jgi:Uma2 family endonuclease
MTAEELLHVHIPNKQVELVRGALVVRELPGYLHGEIVARLAYAVMHHAKAQGLGQVLVGDAGFKLASDPDTVRGPDVAFIRRDRILHPVPMGYAPMAPDLVVEVLSPNDRPGEVLAKVGGWLSAGTSLVWVVDPGRRLARIYRSDGSETVVSVDGALEGEAALPGFSCPLADLFPPLDGGTSR